jgi:hypothetical protein
MLSELRLLLQLFLKYCFYIFLMYRLIRKRPRRRSPQSTGDAVSPRPLPQDEAGDSAVGDANPAMLRSV